MATTANFGAKTTAQQVSTSSLSDTDVAALEAIYALRQRYQVLGYIERQPFLLPVLLEAPTQIRKHFPGAPLSLEVYYDAEDPTWTQLHIGITTPVFDPEGELDKLEALWEEWELPDEVHMGLTVDTEYPLETAMPPENNTGKESISQE